jgi:lipopolysaccharide transport system permease protein
MATEIVIEPNRMNARYWRDMLDFRELAFFLAWRDIKVHYKQTVLGALWAFLRPMLGVAIFAFIFSRVAKLPADTASAVPYGLYVLVAMLPWQLFSATLTETANSLVANSNLISKIYFPRLLVPLSSAGVPMIDFLVVSPVIIIWMLLAQVPFSVSMLTVPLFILFAITAALSFGLALCALNVSYRDVRYVMPFIVQFGVFVSPVGFSTSLIPETYRVLFNLNPMTFVIDGMRWALLNGPEPFSGGRVWVSLLVVFVVAVFGLRYFRATERFFSDVI